MIESGGLGVFSSFYSDLRLKIANSNNTNEIFLKGTPLGLTPSKNLVLVNTHYSSYDEEAEFFWGGMPFLARRVNNNWYIVVSTS